MMLFPIHYEKLNYLPTDIKIFIVRTASLIEQTRSRMKEQGNEVSLPYRMQLKGDCEEIERLIKTFEKGKARKKQIDRLYMLSANLQTESENILLWKFEESMNG